MGRALLHVEDTPTRVALAFGIGLFIAFFPILGIHTGMALALAFAFRLSRVAILTGTWTNNPWTLAPMFTAGTLLGCAILGVPREGLAAIEWTAEGRAFYAALYQGLRPYALPFVVGNLVAGAAAGVVGYVALRSALERRRPVAGTASRASGRDSGGIEPAGGDRRAQQAPSRVAGARPARHPAADRPSGRPQSFGDRR